MDFRPVGRPVEAVVHVPRGAVARRMVARKEDGVERQRPGLARIAVFGHQVGPAQRVFGCEFGVELEVDDVDIRRHLLGDRTDPFSRSPLDESMLVPADELRRRIEKWREEAPAAESLADID